jgi:hypothetical protein
MFQVTIGEKVFTDERIFFDTEKKELIGENELRSDFVSMKEDGLIDANIKFGEYLNNCLSKNGFLEEVEIKTK